MDRYVNSIIRGFKKILNKKYLAVVLVFIGIISVFGVSYGYLSTASGWELATQLKIRKLYYSFTINNSATDEIVVAANSGTTYYNVEITSLNDINTKYVLAYKTHSSATIKVSSASTNKAVGIIGLYTSGTNSEKKKTVRIAVTNSSSASVTIQLKVIGGYSWNSEDEVDLPTGYSIVSGIYNEYQASNGATIGEEISTLLGCTPTASVPCYYTNNSNNYLSYSGRTWRIMGTYLVSGSVVVKAILDDHINSNVTYANVSSALTTFYNGLSDTSLIQGTASSITKAEYDAIGGVNSYLYTKPDENYWTGTQYYVGTSRGSSNLTSTSTAYVRPVITIVPTAVNSATGEVGIKTNPYTIVQGVHLAYASMDYGTPTFPSGYYVAGNTYTVTPPTITNSNYSFDYWTVSGTGASINGNVLTMGTAETTLTAHWSTVKTVTYNCDGGPGTAPSPVQLPVGSNADISSLPCGDKVTAGTSGSVYHQVGWSTTQGGVAESPITVTQNITLYAAYVSLFTYSNSYNVINDGNGDWRIEFKTTGTTSITINADFDADIHVVGGGGGGGGTTLINYSAGGGAGGKTKTCSSVSVTLGSHTIVLGTGGGGSSGTGGTGNASSFDDTVCSATGGTGGGPSARWRGGNGGNGGSGGGTGSTGQGSATGTGGSDGGNGSKGTCNSGDCSNTTVGTGQHTTTRDFGESSGELRAGGGGGGARSGTASGGSGGGGNGGSSGSLAGKAGTDYYGGGGGGGGHNGSTYGSGGKGGCGIVIIRNHRS